MNASGEAYAMGLDLKRFRAVVTTTVARLQGDARSVVGASGSRNSSRCTSCDVKIGDEMDLENQQPPPLLNSPVHLRPSPGRVKTPRNNDYLFSVGHNIVPPLSRSISEDEKTCAICLDPTEERETNNTEGKPPSPIFIISTLECGHVFHFDCILHWFSNSSRCPLCQKDFGVLPHADYGRSRNTQPLPPSHLSTKGIKLTLCILVLVIITLAYLAWWSYANEIGY